jgi:hypothetical protein
VRPQDTTFANVNSPRTREIASRGCEPFDASPIKVGVLEARVMRRAILQIHSNKHSFPKTASLDYHMPQIREFEVCASRHTFDQS